MMGLLCGRHQTSGALEAYRYQKIAKLNPKAVQPLQSLRRNNRDTSESPTTHLSQALQEVGSKRRKEARLSRLSALSRRLSTSTTVELCHIQEPFPGRFAHNSLALLLLLISEGSWALTPTGKMQHCTIRSSTSVQHILEHKHSATYGPSDG
ncbi:hypothetical protein BC628DRAFT_1088621 [Trametes gibbosa]|nr:hypothetical protein BC628DRAFT_1088621 [Trametes gibbosa]